MKQVLAIAVITLLLGCAGQVGTAPVTVPRDEFKAKVEGKTEEQVLDAVGRPDRTSETDTIRSWTYDKRTHDPITGKVDTNVLIIFDRKTGKVISISF